MSIWTSVVPLLSIALVGLGFALSVSPLLAGVAALALMASVLASAFSAVISPRP